MGPGNDDGMFSKLACEISGRRIRLKLGKDVPYSGQEHPADSDDGLFVTTTSLEPAIAFLAFRVFVGLDDSVCDLNEDGLEIRASPGDAGRFHFAVALVIARAAARPGNQMLSGRKHRHIRTDLRKNRNCGHGITG